LGPVGVAGPALSYGDAAAALDAAVELEELGYETLWLPGSRSDPLDRVAAVVGATKRIPVATGILAIDTVPADALIAAYTAIEAEHPGRFVVGLGGAQGPRPLPTMGAYLDTIEETVPVRRRILSALGPKMLGLASRRAAGAYPFLITPDYTARARELIGPDTALIVLQSVVLEPDRARAREMARGQLGFFGAIPSYAGSFRRMGFTDADIQDVSDRLVDGLVAAGDVVEIAARVAEYRQAGADQVVLQVDGAGGFPRKQWRLLAEALR
jgi:probable F420-dependent oxidoreductase